MSAASSPPGPQPFDFRDPAFLADPYPVFRQLRADGAFFKAEYNRWFLTGYEETSQMLRDKRFGRGYDDPEAMVRRFGPTAMAEPAVVELTHMMLMRDPPDHTRLRGLVTKAFTARRIEALRDGIQQLTDRLIDKIAARGSMDLIRALAFPLPVLVICELLGIPEADRQRFVTGSASGGALLNPTPPTREELDRANAGSIESSAYFEALFEQRRREPRDDLISQLVQAEEAGDRLSTVELRANVSLLFAAGHETTVNLIGNGFYSLLRHPEQWRMLRDDPGLVANAIEEVLRFESPVQAVGRTASEPAELGGVALAKHDIVVSLIGGVNRDPAVFDDPERFDITRKDLRPLSFGGGIHFCLGAQLARIEAAVVFETMLRRMPDLRLTDAEHPKWRSSFVLRGLTELPVAWG